MNSNYELFSCFCLLDDCLRSKYEGDTFWQLTDRIHSTKKGSG